MKTWHGGKFSSNEIIETEQYFEDFDKSHFLKGLKKWQKSWKKCIDLKGDYLEKLKNMEKLASLLTRVFVDQPS